MIIVFGLNKIEVLSLHLQFKNLNRVALNLMGDLANVSLKHLKHNDLVYVSGVLSSYHKTSSSGERCILYQVW
jgi:hypothetical protein